MNLKNLNKLLLAALFLGLSKIALAGAYDEVMNPPTYTRAECESLPDAVWVNAEWQENGNREAREASACIRYVASADAAGASTAIIFVDGDVSSNSSSGIAVYEELKTRSAEMANSIARQTGLPVIRLARPGTFGSSGMSHLRDRRMPIEVHLVDAAVTQIKQRYGYERIQLAGQSTGGGLVGALMTLGREDIDCAVIGSGVTSVKTRSRHLNSDNYHQGQDETGNPLDVVYDPIDHVGSIVRDEQRRIFVIGDPQDKAVSFESQHEFHERLIASGIRSTLLTVEATDSNHHSLAAPAQRIAGLCKSGRTDVEIQALLQDKPA